MSSKIQQELEKATGVSRESGEGKQTYYTALAKAVNKLSDKDFDALSKGAQDWFNDAADNAEAKKDIVDFPDMQEEEAPTTRRRRSVSDEDDTTAKAKAKEYEPAKGDKVNITTKRGKVIAAVEFVEIEDGKLIVYKDDEGLADTPLDGAKIESAEPPKEETTSRRRSNKDEDDALADPKVGDTVEVTNKRGKVYVGILKEDDGETIVLETVGGDLEDIVKANVTKVVVKHSPKAVAKDDEPKTSSRRGAAKDEEPEGKAKKTTKDDNGGASISDIVNETIIDNLDEPVEVILKKMTKDGVVFREDTAKLNYKQAYKLIAKLRAAKLMK